MGQGSVHRATVSPVTGAPATARPPGENATGPEPMLWPVMVVIRVTLPGPVTFHRVTVLLPAMVVSACPPAENASATSGKPPCRAGGAGTVRRSVAVMAG